MGHSIASHLNRWPIAGLVVLSVVLATSVSHGQATPSAGGNTDSVKPFPENRVRDFYLQQAEKYRSVRTGVPEVLAAFPGLDGGSFGHWGQNPEADNFDHHLNEIDYGNLQSQVVNHFGATTTKAIVVHTGDHAVLFDPARLTWTDAWKGRLLTWDSRRFGITSGVRPDGERAWAFRYANWTLPAGQQRQYLGLFRSGKRVVFHYRLGSAEVYDSCSEFRGVLRRELWIRGRLPAGTSLELSPTAAARQVPERPQTLSVGTPQEDYRVTLRGSDPTVRLIAESGGRVLFGDTSREQEQRLVLAFHVEPQVPAAALEGTLSDDPQAVARLTRGGTPQWARQAVTTRGQLGAGASPFLIDRLEIPFGEQNPFRAPLRIGGFDFLSDGRAIVATLEGDVWQVAGIDSNLDELRWTRVAAGLHQPLGVVVRNDRVFVLGRDQITELVDLNRDQEFDYYRCQTNNYPTQAGNNFALTLHQDQAGQFYWFTRSDQFGMTRWKPGTAPESIATGLRGTNGTGVSARGDIVLATVQEGSWTPATAIFEVGNGSYHGFFGPRAEYGRLGYQLPLCFVPRGIDNSAGDLIFLPEDARLGPLSGRILGTSFGYCQHYLVLREQIGERVQGGIVPLAGEFHSGAHRIRFNPRDGGIYVAGTDGWQSYARANGSLERLRYSGKPMVLPEQVSTYKNGIRVRLNRELDPESVGLDAVFCQQWNYLYGPAYGSKEYSVRYPGRPGHDYVPVRAVHLLADLQSVFLEIPQLHPVMQFHLNLSFRTADGGPADADIYYSIFAQQNDFTDFPGYRPAADQKFSPPFPIAEQFPQDPRLVAQEAKGKVLNEIFAAKIDAVAGLQYQPSTLRVPPGRRIALTIRNQDPSMPHNFVLLRPGNLRRIGEASMQLAADPNSVAIHYAPLDDAVLCLAPILGPGQQYTIYFDSPTEPGAYPFVCTYPGHWRVMQGLLYVVAPGDPLPESNELDLSRRQFVKMWKLDDFRQSEGRGDPVRGKRVFEQAECGKCHSFENPNQALGPDLRESARKHQGLALLQQILEPSQQIHPKFVGYTVLQTDGRTVTGIFQERTESEIVLGNPLNPQVPVRIPLDQIEAMKVSSESTMPKGLLMTFEAAEIQDLLAYLRQQAGSACDLP